MCNKEKNSFCCFLIVCLIVALFILASLTVYSVVAFAENDVVNFRIITINVSSSGVWAIALAILWVIPISVSMICITVVVCKLIEHYRCPQEEDINKTLAFTIIEKMGKK